MTTLTVGDIARGYEDDRWLGWGYLGGRRHLDVETRDRADAIVLDYANAHRWSADRLFEWMNSRPGRHFADWPDQPGADQLLGARLDASTVRPTVTTVE